jgi:hypothetical protein
MPLKKSTWLVVALIILGLAARAQNPLMNRIPRGVGGGQGGGSDSIQFEKRNFADDSVTIRFRYLDTARFSPLIHRYAITLTKCRFLQNTFTWGIMVRPPGLFCLHHI